MILFRLFAYAFILLCREQDIIPDYAFFVKNVEAALNGDDNTFTTSDEIVGWFNPTNIRRVWESVGVTTKTPCDEPRHVTDCAFLSQNSVWDEATKCWFPSPITEKVLCSLRFGSAFRDVKWHLLRAHALRIDSYGNEECRKILSAYINYLNENYEDQMIGSCNGLSVGDIQNVWKTDCWLSLLYSGCESSGFEGGVLSWIDEILELAGVTA